MLLTQGFIEKQLLSQKSYEKNFFSENFGIFQYLWNSAGRHLFDEEQAAKNKL